MAVETTVKKIIVDQLGVGEDEVKPQCHKGIDASNDYAV